MPEMVNAILDDRKTRTRRPLRAERGQRIQVGDFIGVLETWKPKIWNEHEVLQIQYEDHRKRAFALGDKGLFIKIHEDRIENDYVRNLVFVKKLKQKLSYKGYRQINQKEWADPLISEYKKIRNPERRFKCHELPPLAVAQRPGRFLPTGGIRLLLEVTDVTQCAAADISTKEIEEEGIQADGEGDPFWQWKKLWDSMYGGTKYSIWENPQCLNIAFRIHARTGIDNDFAKLIK